MPGPSQTRRRISMNEVLDPDLIYDIYSGALRRQIIRLALQLDVFTTLADRPADLLTAGFGAGLYDLCLLGQITDYLTPGGSGWKTGGLLGSGKGETSHEASATTFALYLLISCIIQHHAGPEAAENDHLRT